MKATPEQLRAMWAAIPGVEFNPKRPKPITPARNKENCNKAGKPRKYLVGHPGQKYYSVAEALELLQINRVTLIHYANKLGFHVEKRCLKDKKGNIIAPSAFYLKSEIRNFHKQRKQHHENA